jgi:coenzyme PQQ precursor peptide PqqA
MKTRTLETQPYMRQQDARRAALAVLERLGRTGTVRVEPVETLSCGMEVTAYKAIVELAQRTE